MQTCPISDIDCPLWQVLKFTGVIGGNRAVRTTQPWVIPAERQSNESTPMQTWICVLRKLFEPTSSLPLPERRFREQTLEKVPFLDHALASHRDAQD